MHRLQCCSRRVERMLGAASSFDPGNPDAASNRAGSLSGCMAHWTDRRKCLCPSFGTRELVGLQTVEDECSGDEGIRRGVFRARESSSTQQILHPSETPITPPPDHYQLQIVQYLNYQYHNGRSRYAMGAGHREDRWPRRVQADPRPEARPR